MWEHLEQTLNVKSLSLKNRMVVSAMVTSYGTGDGTATERYIVYHEAKARGGWGLVITEDYEILPGVGASDRLPGLYQDALIPSHQQLTERVHAAGGKIVCQIYHAGRATSSSVTGVQPVGPSALRDPALSEIPRALTEEEIAEIVEAFAACALRVKKAGFDGVEIHGAHGYLLHQFVSPFSNKRTDDFGGALIGRTRFPLQVVKAVREKVGDDFPIFYRMSAVDYMEGGLSIEESKAFAMLLEKAGVDVIHCSQGIFATTETIIAPSMIERAAFIQNAAALKEVVSIPVIGVGRINDPLLAETLLASGKCDLVTMARASLADPELPIKIQHAPDELLRCIGCLQGCAGEGNLPGGSVRCLVNPLTGMESQYHIEPAEKPLHIFVAGGGISGCEAAILAARRGHQVTLFEQTEQIGGQWNAACVPPGKSEFASFVQWQAKQLQRWKVEVHLKHALTKEEILLKQPDAVIIATGGTTIIPRIQGVEQTNVVSAIDVLLGNVQVGKTVLVIGGGLVGAETADHLAAYGHSVTLVELQPELMAEGEAAARKLLLARLEKHKVEVYTQTQVQYIEKNKICLKKQQDNDSFFKTVDHVVLAVGTRSNHALFDELQDYDGHLIRVGDAAGVKNGLYNIREGFEAGITI